MKILITGASGFIGNFIVKELLNHGHILHTFTRKNNYNIPGTKTFTGNIKDISTLEFAFNDIDAVIHNAAYANDWGKKSIFYDTNVEGTRNIAEACKKYGVKRLLYTSTAGIYGFPNNLTPLKEVDGPTRKPLNNYGASKIESEALLKKYSDLNITIIRPPMVFGAGGKTTQILLSTLEQGKAAYIGKGEKHISIVHPADVAQCFRLALEKEKDGAFNTVSFYCTIQEIFEACSKQLGVYPPQKHFPFFLAYLKGFFSELFAKNEPSLTRFRVIKLGTSRIIDSEKAKKELGFKPSYDLQKTVEDMVSWYKTLAKE
jgi:nucleoside-diphosphate-sugar epimerase